MAEPRDSMLDPKYLGGLIGGKGYAFQNGYVLYRLPEWLLDPAFVGFQPEGWEDVEVFYEDDEGKRREAIQVKDHAVTPAEARDILAEFQRRAGRGARDGIDWRFRLACVGVSPKLQPVETLVKLLQARSGYTDAEKAGTRAELAEKVNALGLGMPAEFVEGIRFETKLGGVTREAVLRDVLTMRLQRGGYGLSVEGAERAYEGMMAALFRWLQEARYVTRADVEAIIHREAGRHPEEEPAEATQAGWRLVHPYAMPPHFTGRADERWMLSSWLHPADRDSDHRLLVMRALGGFGKSALAWHWLRHDVDTRRWPRVLWWDFWEDSNFNSFLGEALEYLGLDPGRRSPRQQADDVLKALHQPDILLVLDGFERILRAYGRMDAAYQGDVDPIARSAQLTDCVSPIAEFFLRSVAALPGIRSKVLLTTRLRPRALEAPGGELLAGCREVELAQMKPADAVAFFRAQGVRGGRAEIEAACAPYGYHPLSLRLLAGMVMRDPRQPGDIAAARRLDLSGDLVQRQHHVLEAAYANLNPEGQRLLSTIACFRGPVTHAMLAGMEGVEQRRKPEFFHRLLGRRKETGSGRGERPFDPAALDDGLRELVDRGLLHHDRQAGRYDLHAIVRRYAYDRLGGEARTGVHGWLRDYFAAVPPPEQVESLEDLDPVIELYHHTVRAGQYDEALGIFSARLQNPVHYQFGAYELQIELLCALFPDGDPSTSSGQAALPRLREESHQATTLNALAVSLGFSGQPRLAVPLLEQHNAIRETQRDKRNLAAGLSNLALQQMVIGALRATETSHRRAIALCQEIEYEFGEAIGHLELGRLLAHRGEWAEAEGELAEAMPPFEQPRNVQAQGVIWACCAERALLMARHSAPGGDPDSQIGSRKQALDCARRALELADETARTEYPLERDYVRAHWLLGAAHREAGELDAADRHLSEALTRCRGINLVVSEAAILVELARLRIAQGHRDEALRHAEEALIITERSEYVLQGADVHLFLADMAIEEGNREKALEYARQARALATCDGPPDYTYKVAYEEAGAFLAQLGEPAD